MLFLEIVFAWMPFVILGLSAALGFFWKFSSASLLLKIILTVVLVAFSIAWWMAAGRKVWEERQGEKFAQSYVIKLPPNYNGVFAIRFQKSDADSGDPVIVLPENGIALVKISERNARGLPRSRFSVETQNGHVFHYSGTTSMRSGESTDYFFAPLKLSPLFSGAKFPLMSTLRKSRQRSRMGSHSIVFLQLLIRNVMG